MKYYIRVVSCILLGAVSQPFSAPAADCSGVDRSSHVDSLRQLLALPDYVKLQWQSSNDGIDTLRVIDDFNRTEVGDHWARLDTAWQISNGELQVARDEECSWCYLALFLPVPHVKQRPLYSVSYRWGPEADSAGIKEGSHALFIDQPSPEGSGYWLWYRTNFSQVWLWAIRPGTVWPTNRRNSEEIALGDSRLAIKPYAGDVVMVFIREEPDTLQFDYFVNDSLCATVGDPRKEYLQQDTSYAGVFMRGTGVNNQIDDFTITWLSPDRVAPAAIADLAVADSSLNSIVLTWTAPGDNGWQGQAVKYEIRYATTALTNHNFQNATLVSPAILPDSACQPQRFEISGLTPYTRYWFAARAIDEVGNHGGISNIVSTRTTGDGIAQAFAFDSSCPDTLAVDESHLLVVSVVDRFQAPVHDFPVRFRITRGAASLNGDSESIVLTDLSGKASSSWHLGITPGEYSVEAQALGLAAAPLVCNTVAIAGAPNTIRVVSGEGQVLPINATTAPISVLLQDSLLNAVANAAVEFEILSGAGRFVATESRRYLVRTDRAGMAEAQLNVGLVFGDTTWISATISDNRAPRRQQEIYVVAAAPTRMTEHAGNNQIAHAGEQLPDSIQVRVFDATETPARRFPVTFHIRSGAGNLANGDTLQGVVTDENGIAGTQWRLGMHVGNQRVRAIAKFHDRNLAGSPINFHAFATDSIVSEVDQVTGTAPAQFALLQCAPNPLVLNGSPGLNGAAGIYFELPQRSSVVIQIFDIRGRRLKEWQAQQFPAGRHQLLWDGRNSRAQVAESGLYFVRMVATSESGHHRFEATRKLLLVK